MKQQIEPKLTRTKKLIATIPPVLLIVANLFLFGPFTIYEGNIDELAVSLITILQYYFIPTLIILIVLSIIGIFLSLQLFKRYIAILFAIGVLIWFQGNILVWDYGVIGKAEIDWTQDTWRGWLDSSIWIILIISAILFYKHIYQIARLSSITLVLLQTILLGFNSFQYPKVWNEKMKYSKPPKEMFEFSSKQNVIHIILDELQSDIFQEIIEKDTNHYYDVFKGFIFFRETAGSFPTTIMSIPAFLSGQIYPPDVPINNFVDSVYKGKTIPNVLYDNGFEVDLAAEQSWYGNGRHTNWYYIPVPYGISKIDYDMINSTRMMGLVLFRHSPHFLKNSLSNQLISLPIINLKETESYEALRHISQKSFLQDLIENTSVKRRKSIYKLIHLTTTHWPMVLNKNCEYTGKIFPFTWENIKIQAKCSLDHFIEFLEKLKLIGVYDSSLIIIHADHGYWKIPRSSTQVKLQNLDKQLEPDFPDEEDFAQKVCASLPFLAIKLPNSNERFKISNAPAAITDIPATISNILNINGKFNGKSILDIDSNEVRERKFFYYYDLNRSGDKFFNRIDEYIIKGRMRDRTSWKFISMHLPPGTSHTTDKIIFGTDGAARFLRAGWSFREVDPDKEGLTYTWAVGKSASIFLTLPKTKVQLTANVRTPFDINQQLVTVKVDGKEVGAWKNSKQWVWERHSVIVKSDENRPNVSTIDFIFSKHHEPSQKDGRRLALLFESITLEEQ